VIITPKLPSPAQPPSDPERMVSAVRPANKARDSLDGGESRRDTAPSLSKKASLENVDARLEAIARPHHDNLPLRVNRALSAYADVAEAQDRTQIQTLLGLDEFA
jgi:hypothetical protein